MGNQQVRKGEELPEGTLKSYLLKNELIQSANSEWKDKSLMIESIHSSPSLCAVI